MIYKLVICFLAGMGAGLGTGFAGMSAAAVISPMLIAFLGMEPYMAVGIAVASDVLASAVSAYTYGKNKNLDIKNGLVMMAAVLAFTLVGSYVSSLVPSTAMGGFSIYDAASGNKVYCEAGHDDQSFHGRRQCQEKDHTVPGLRQCGWFHLRLCRSGRRHDDASAADQRAGL